MVQRLLFLAPYMVVKAAQKQAVVEYVGHDGSNNTMEAASVPY